MVNGFELRAILAYNLTRGPEPENLFHREMGDLSEADLVFVPINLPYTMPPEAAASCKVGSPRVVAPYHQGESDP